VARNILTEEIKYFLANHVPGRDGWSLRKILRVAFGRWPIEDCFREAKGELLTVEQVRRAVNNFLEARALLPRYRIQHYQYEANRQAYYARRNAQASRSHRKTRRQQLADLGIDPRSDQIRAAQGPAQLNSHSRT
jgi:hypothetical protein